MATIAELIEKYEGMQELEEVGVLKRLYSSLLDDLKGVSFETDMERRRRLLKVEVDTLERLEFGNRIIGTCKRCGMPCVVGEGKDARWAQPAAGGGVICRECL